MLAIQELKPARQHLTAHSSDTAQVQALFQQWKALTIELGEVLVALLGEPGKGGQGDEMQNVHPLRARREARNLTRERLAEDVGMGAVTIKRTH